jgi:hypothetical protein
MRYTILIAIFSLLFIACKKDKFTTEPQLKFKSVNTDVVPKDGLLVFNLSFTDAQGDEDSLFMFKITSNCAASNLKDSSIMPSGLPHVKNQEADLIISYKNSSGDYYPYMDCSPKCTDNDTCYFRFVLIDKAKNKSDTINSGQIIILK